MCITIFDLFVNVISFWKEAAVWEGSAAQISLNLLLRRSRIMWLNNASFSIAFDFV